MKVIYGVGKVKVSFKKPIVTIGIFDGVHLGHKFIIKKLIDKAKKINGTSVVLTFDPHPKNILRPKKYLPLLISIEHRVKLLRDLGVDVCIIEEFSQGFSRLSPEGFIRRLFVKTIKPQEVFVGSGFTFGRSASGDIDLLRELGRQHNFKVNEVLPIKIGKEIVSSTSIRRLIRQGDLHKASKFLGREVSILGKVRRGRNIGRLLGYPTANIYPCGEIIPPTGVYAARVNFDKKKRLAAMAYIGSRPTYNKKVKDRCFDIEVHIFDFKKKIYGRYIEIEFLKEMRDERKFSSQEELKKQIEKDQKAVKHFLKAHHKK